MEQAKINQSINRNSCIELLRIFAMILIIFHHMFTHGYYRNDLLKINDKAWFWINSFSWLGMVGNYIFMLITGYYTHFISLNKSKLAAKKIYLKLFSYSVIIGLIFFVFKLSFVPNNADVTNIYKDVGFYETARKFGKLDFLKSFFPFILNTSWFASSYIIFCFFIPYINRMLETLTNKEHLILCIISVLLGSVIQSIPLQAAFFPNAIFQFFMMFFIGSYIYKHKENVTIKNFVIWGTIIFSISFIILSQFLILKFGYKFNINIDILLKFSKKISTSFFTVIISVGIFVLFLRMRPFQNNFINAFGKSTFGVYLIHDNAYLSIFMWNCIFKINESQEIFPLKNCMIPFVIFIIASGLDILFDSLLRILHFVRRKNENN